MKQYISLYLKDKSLNAESLQEKSQKRWEVKEECKNAELAIMNIKEEYEDKNQKLKSELQDAEDQELELEMY
ncbi:unnamed protein product [Rhizophagus irregularis]|nr:unnamed protein product [Rhizophagus irregularis]